MLARVAFRRGTAPGLTEGQRYSAAIVVAVVVITSAIGIPPTLRHRPSPSAAPADRAAPLAVAAPSDGAPAATGEDRVPGPVAGATFFASAAAAATLPGVAATAPAAVPSSSSRFPITTVATIGGSAGLSGVTVLGDTLFAASLPTAGPAKLVALPAAGGSQRDIALDGTAGIAEPVGGVTGMGQAVVVAEPGRGVVVTVNPASGAQSVLTTIPDVPACPFATAGPAPIPLPLTCEPSAVDRPARPDAVATLGDGSLLIADSAQATIWRLAGGLLLPWLQSSELAAPNAVRALVAVPDGVVFVSAAGTLYHATQGAGGAVDTVEAIFELRAGDDARGLARGRNGHLYVALAGPSEVLVLGPDGIEAGRITGSEQPTALVLAGTQLFITGAGARVVRGDVSALES